MIEYARINKVPYLGICFGMQMAIIEYARNVLKVKNSTSSEISDDGEFVVGMMNEWINDSGATSKASANLGGTMRLGAYKCNIDKDSLAFSIYQKAQISERHRHRYEVNINWREKFEKAGLKFSGISPDGKLTEIVEVANHPFFVGVQFHPELKSKPFAPHPLFVAFVKSAIEKKKSNS